MKKLLMVAAIAFLAAFAGNWLGNSVHAQTTVALQLTGSAPHTTCTVTAQQTTFCFASDGLFQSLNGAAYTQLGAVAPGVVSLNGKQGALVIAETSTPPTITVSVQ